MTPPVWRDAHGHGRRVRIRGAAASIELKKWDRYGNRAKIRMTRLAKTHDATWFNGSTSSLPPSNLDHVFTSTNLTVRSFSLPFFEVTD